MAIRVLTNGKLIEASNRIVFSEDEAGLGGAMPPAFRLTTRGAYHLRAWMLTFSYLDAVAVDTPIFDLETREAIRSNIRSLSLEQRFERATRLRSYLGNVWQEMSFNVDYFDWAAVSDDMNWTFARAKPAVDYILSSSRDILIHQARLSRAIMSLANRPRSTRLGRPC